MASYTLLITAFLVIYSSSIIETSSASRSNPPSASDSVSVKPPTRTTNNNALEQSMGQVPQPFPFYYPYSYGQGYPYSYGQGNPYSYGQPAYLPNNQFPPVYPTMPYPYSSYNPTMPYPQGPSTIYGAPSIGVGGPDRASSKARP